MLRSGESLTPLGPSPVYRPAMSGIRVHIGRLFSEPARVHARDVIAIAIAAVAFAVGAVAFMVGEVESGVRLSLGDDGRVYVVDVDPWSPQSASGLPGMVVTTLNDQTLIVMPGDEGTPVAGQ